MPQDKPNPRIFLVFFGIIFCLYTLSFYIVTGIFDLETIVNEWALIGILISSLGSYYWFENMRQKMNKQIRGKNAFKSM